MDPQGKWALVTGGAKRLGKGIALGLAEAGANVVVHHGHSPDDAAQTVREIEKLDVLAFALEADLTRPEAIERMFSEIEKRCGRLQILVNSAASFRRQALEEITAQEFDDVVDLNLRAPWLCLQRASRLMPAAAGSSPERGVVVNISDLTGVLSWPGYSHHGVSKAGLIHLTKVAARELAPGIRVNFVVPGAILPPPGMSADDPQWIQKGLGVPLQRAGDPTVIGDAIVFLVRNQFITGSVLTVDGGEHLLGGRPADAADEGGEV